MIRQHIWFRIALILGIVLLLSGIAGWWVIREIDSWAASTPSSGARATTERLLTAAQTAQTSSLPSEFQSFGIDPLCWMFLKRAMTIPHQQPEISVVENGNPAFRDDDLIVTINFKEQRSVRLLFLAGGVVDCTTSGQ
jgi:hypothetical protein